MRAAAAFEQLDAAVAAFIEQYGVPSGVVPRQAWGRRELEALQRDIISSLHAEEPHCWPSSFDALMGQLNVVTILFHTLLRASSVLSGAHSTNAMKDEDMRFRRELGEDGELIPAAYTTFLTVRHWKGRASARDGVRIFRLLPTAKLRNILIEPAVYLMPMLICQRRLRKVGGKVT